MSFPTLTEIYEQTRSKCGDTEVSGGQIYTNALLLPHVQEAVRVLWRGLANLGTPGVRRTFYYTLPANTSIFYPSTAGITDFTQPSGAIAQRGSITQVAITGAVAAATGLQVTCGSAHSLTTGNVVTLEQIGGLYGANILATVTVSSPTVFIANGVVVSGAYTSVGYVSTSTNEFVDVPQGLALPAASNQSNTELSGVIYQEGRFQFNPATAASQIRIAYWSSGKVPASGSDQIPVNDCIDFVSVYAAAEASKSQGANDRYAMLHEQALGPSYSEGVFGGEMRQLFSSAVRQLQNLSPYDRGPMTFRNGLDSYWGGV